MEKLFFQRYYFLNISFVMICFIGLITCPDIFVGNLYLIACRKSGSSALMKKRLSHIVYWTAFQLKTKLFTLLSNDYFLNITVVKMLAFQNINSRTEVQILTIPEFVIPMNHCSCNIIYNNRKVFCIF